MEHELSKYCDGTSASFIAALFAMVNLNLLTDRVQDLIRDGTAPRAAVRAAIREKLPKPGEPLTPEDRVLVAILFDFGIDVSDWMAEREHAAAR